MAHDDVNELKQRVKNQSVQIMRLEERVRSLTVERDHWIADAGKARDEAARHFAETCVLTMRLATVHATHELIAEAESSRMEPGQFIRPYPCPQSWWQRIIGRLFA